METGIKTRYEFYSWQSKSLLSVHNSIKTYIYTYTYTNICRSICIYVYRYILIHLLLTHVYICVYNIYISICVRIYVYIYMDLNIYIYIDLYSDDDRYLSILWNFLRKPRWPYYDLLFRYTFRKKRERITIYLVKFFVFYEYLK